MAQLDMSSIGRSVRLVVAIAASMALASPLAAYARGPLPRPEVDCEAPRCRVAETIANECPCDGAVSHRSHVQCVSRIAKGLVLVKALARECRGAVVRCAARSTCGNPELAACRRPIAGGGLRCRISRSAARCEITGGAAESGSCCRSCTTTTSTTTSTSTSTTTTTLVPCGGVFPACLGSCPPGEQCTAASIGAPCVCMP